MPPHITSTLRSRVRALRNQASLFVLGRSGSRPRAVARTIRAGSGRLSVSERRWIDRIEALRGELEASDESIEKVDYGAGTSCERRDRAEMARGVTVVESIGRITSVSSKKPPWALLLFRLVRECRPVSCVEMGTSVGISGAYQAAALALNGEGHLVTLEGAASVAAVAKRNFERLGLTNVRVETGRFQDTLTRTFADEQPVDYVFVDGHHDGSATVEYFETIVEYLSPEAILVIDDIAWSEGMRQAWTAISSSTSVRISIDLGLMGVCIRGGGGSRRHLGLRLP